MEKGSGSTTFQLLISRSSVTSFFEFLNIYLRETKLVSTLFLPVNHEMVVDSIHEKKSLISTRWSANAHGIERAIIESIRYCLNFYFFWWFNIGGKVLVLLGPGECLVDSDCQLPGFHTCGPKSCLNTTVFRLVLDNLFYTMQGSQLYNIHILYCTEP